MKECKLYKGEVVITFNDEGKKHLYLVNDEKNNIHDSVADGVTSILSVINKPALIPWAINQMAKNLEENLKTGKVYDELEKEKLIETAKKIYKDKTKDAADIGKIVHKWCEDYIKGLKPERPINEFANNCIQAFLEFEERNNIKFKLSERIVYSRKYNYAGTLDLTAIVNDKNYVCDFKTSSGIYPESHLQTAAYGMALKEEYPSIKIDGSIIIRLPKEGKLETCIISSEEQTENFKSFLGALVLYRGLKVLNLQLKK